MKKLLSIIGICLLTGTVSLQAQQRLQDAEQPDHIDRYTQNHAKEGDDTDKQQTHSVPFASRENSLELAIANTTGGIAKDVSVRIEDIPEWMEFHSTDFVVGSLEAGREATAGFTFHIDEQAPVGQPVTLTVTARSGQQISWERNIKMQVAPPSKFELDQNYPNPFNPTTTIKYRLPAQMKVTVTVFDVLGRRVATLADGLQAPGTQTLSWDASRMASGLYFYRVVAEGEGGKRLVQHKKMLLVK